MRHDGSAVRRVSPWLALAALSVTATAGDALAKTPPPNTGVTPIDPSKLRPVAPVPTVDATVLKQVVVTPKPTAQLNLLTYTLLAKHLQVTATGVTGFNCYSYPSSLPEYEKKTCTVTTGTPVTIVVHAIYMGASAAQDTPVPVADFGPGCTSLTPGICTVTLTKDTNIKIG